MSFKPYLAELLGTFVLALFVCLSVIGESRISPVLVAPAVLGLFVYAIGWVSGAHLNPAVTIGLASIKKIGFVDAVYYVLAQLLGAVLAAVVCWLMTGSWPGANGPFGAESIREVVAEAMGAFLLAWAILAVVERKVHAAASGLVIGFGLCLGILLAMELGAAAILNPAVALGIGSLSLSHIAGPVLGAVAAAWAYRALAEAKHEAVSTQ